jgi:hypothetical protein
MRLQNIVGRHMPRDLARGQVRAASWRPLQGHRGLRRPHLDPRLLGRLGLQFADHRRGLDLIEARGRNRHVAVELDAPGARAHEDDAAAHEHRLVDVLGDEAHRLALLCPDAEQQLCSSARV